MRSSWKALLVLLIFCFLSACGGRVGYGDSIWIAVPIENLQVKLGGQIHIEGHVTNSGDPLFVEVWAGEELLDVLRNFDSSDDLIPFEYFWTPEAAGQYVISVIARTKADEVRGQDSVRVEVLQAEGSEPTEVIPTITPTEPSPEVVETETVCEPSLMAIMNANCRFGPDGVFDVLGYLLEGETATIAGRLADNSWWLIPNPDRAGECWIASNVVASECVSDLIPIVAAPPTPTPEPHDTTPPPVPQPVYPANGGSVACMAQVALAWNPVSDESGIEGHTVQVERSSDNSTWSSVIGSPWNTGDGNKHTINVECGWYYRWRVRATDGEGNQSAFSAWSTFAVDLE